MIDEKFTEGSTWVHQLDPRIKIVITMMLAVVTAVGKNVDMLLVAFGFSGLLLITARLDIKKVGKRLLIVNSFIFLMWLILPFTYPGEGLFQVGPLIASREGVIYTAKITLRSNTIMLIMISLLSTSAMSSIIHAMKYLYIPEKLIYLLFFIYRYIHVIKTEFGNLYSAMLLRGFKPNTTIHCYKSYAYLVGRLLIKSYERSQRVYEAMTCRGFKGKFYILDNFNLSSLDYLVFVGSLFLVSCLVMLESGYLMLK
ncbi:cobalt ECF transporter T component CbiQ [Acetohalobium arabaticum]|uniref:Cobalt ABC transporter, inner membrane subunit CbiQ n=1 Tax=Acetohalobium arabaticum (strain ATCC 49924 / DSM 5501 / Z-7288) TaxID=574087 RepID=D9QVQ9_ACEAZ|nr:cobalt ECF transporter T component CbiQ [Acetohalobium arabaticum]ADL12318.1 cobalt ABC transporter, inner membrane subunit CbiQ [Acetohalobium arabaticum DSM 5501]